MLITIFIIIVLIMSAIFHEYAHGWVAYKLGDYTAKDAGRLTLNPLSHLDPVGSILMPLLLIVARSGFILAWAKPVPYNPYNLKDQKYGDLKVAIGGPGTNFLLALFFGLIARIISIPLDLKQGLAVAFLQTDYNFMLQHMYGSIMSSIFVMSIIICFINLLLMVFNLVPLPPLDGSKILMTFLSYNWKVRLQRIEPFGFFIILFLMLFGFFNLILLPVLLLFSKIVGV